MDPKAAKSAPAKIAATKNSAICGAWLDMRRRQISWQRGYWRLQPSRGRNTLGHRQVLGSQAQLRQMFWDPARHWLRLNGTACHSDSKPFHPLMEVTLQPQHAWLTA